MQPLGGRGPVQRHFRFIERVPVMAVDDIFEFKIHGVCEGQPVLNVWHYLLYSAAGSTLDMAAAVTALKTKWDPGLRNLLSSNYTLQKMTFQLVGKFNAPLVKARSLVQETFVDLTGGIVSAPLPPQCALYQKLICVSSNDLYLRGAKYFGGIPANKQIGGLMDNAYLNDFDTMLTTAQGDVSVPGGDGGTLKCCIWSKKRYKAMQIPYIGSITNWNLNPNVKTQRRRTLGSASGAV